MTIWYISRVESAMNKVEEPYSATVLQQAIGEPLRSEQRATEFLPRVLSPFDMLVILIAIVLFIPDGTVVQVTQLLGRELRHAIGRVGARQRVLARGQRLRVAVDR